MNLTGCLSTLSDNPDDSQADGILSVGRTTSNASEVQQLLVTPRKPPKASALVFVERDPHVRDLEAFFLNEAGFLGLIR